MRSFLFAILVFTIPASAQTVAGPTDRGSLIIDGSASVSRSETEGQSSTNISVQPGLLRFISSGLAIGGRLGLGYSDHETGSSSSWRVGPSARLYFGSSPKTLKYIGASVLFGSASASSDGPASSESDASIWGVEGVAGLTYMVSRQVGISGEVFAARQENTFELVASPKVTTTSTDYGIRFGLAVFVF